MHLDEIYSQSSCMNVHFKELKYALLRRLSIDSLYRDGPDLPFRISKESFKELLWSVLFFLTVKNTR